MGINEIDRLTRIVSRLYSEMGTFKDVAAIFGISKQDIIYLLLATEADKIVYFKDKNFDHLPIYNPNV